MRMTLDGTITGETREVLVNGSKTSLSVIESKIQEAVTKNEHSRRIFYLVANRMGAPVVGDLDIPLPSLGWHNFNAPRKRPFAEGVTALRADVIGLPGGERLVVAVNSTVLKHLDALIRRSFVIGFGMTLLIGLAAGIEFGRHALVRVEAMGAATREIMAGDFSRRIPLAGTDDEFDRLANTVNSMLGRIEQLMESLHAIGCEIAHDVRSPLGRLRESLELALRTDDNVVLRGSVGEAIQETDLALNLCGAILRLAEVESGIRRASLEPIDLSQLLVRLVETYETVAEENGDHIVAMISENLVLTGDSALLNQLFANLIENAMKYASPKARIVLRAWREASAIIVRVEDNGPGIPAARRAEALRRFGQLDHTRRTPGHGLGLALAAAISDLHNATLELEDAWAGQRRPGLAVAVRFQLPVSSARYAPLTADKRAQAASRLS